MLTLKAKTEAKSQAILTATACKAVDNYYNFVYFTQQQFIHDAQTFFISSLYTGTKSFQNPVTDGIHSYRSTIQSFLTSDKIQNSTY